MKLSFLIRFHLSKCIMNRLYCRTDDTCGLPNLTRKNEFEELL